MIIFQSALAEHQGCCYNWLGCLISMLLPSLRPVSMCPPFCCLSLRLLAVMVPPIKPTEGPPVPRPSLELACQSHQVSVPFAPTNGSPPTTFHDATQSNKDRESNAITDDDDNSDSTHSVTGDRPDADQNQFLKHINSKLRALQFKHSLLTQSRKRTSSKTISHDPDVAQPNSSTSPRTTRQHMLETELPPEMRKELLHERKQNTTQTAKANSRRPIAIDVGEHAYPDYTPETDYNWRGW
jgi:hypothetical protein